MKYLWGRPNGPAVTFSPIHNLADMFEDYKCGLKIHKKRMKWRERKRMNERSVKILIADEDGRCMMFAYYFFPCSVNVPSV